MKEKVCVVTGGNAGIGKAIASELARMQAHVVIVSRNREKGELALADIRQEAPMGQVELVVGDLSTAAGTRQLANTLLAQLPHIHVLVNNAGVWLTQRQLNVDGLEMTFMVNHLAPFILTNMLLARLQASAPARIVNVNAGLYVNGRFNLQQTPYGHDFHRLRTYANSKLGNIF
ncbi:MAG: SDR family NAD(P)-dependent oxidoreductase, partial [Anaerolineales bacterium]|nr:SDR family NAD(P)-dependent oxidoreductase [Anaerolineales bacterium]